MERLELVAYMFTGEGGRKRTRLQVVPSEKQSLPKQAYSAELSTKLVDTVHTVEGFFQIFWNKEFFSSLGDLRGLLKKEAVPAVLVVGEKPPLVIRSEPIDDDDIGFVVYRADGKAISCGDATIHADGLEFAFRPVYRNVSLFSCAHVSGGGKVQKPPAAGPKPR